MDKLKKLYKNLTQKKMIKDLTLLDRFAGLRYKSDAEIYFAPKWWKLLHKKIGFKEYIKDKHFSIVFFLYLRNVVELHQGRIVKWKFKNVLNIFEKRVKWYKKK